MQLKTYLKRLRIPIGTVLSSHGGKPFTIEAYLAQLVKQSYLDKQKINQGSNTGPQKRGRASAAAIGEDTDASYEWKWGNRAIAEIGEQGIASFVVEFMDGIDLERQGGGGEEDPDQPASRDERDKKAKRKEQLANSIARAVGNGGIEPYK